jgi:phage terminase Nu1 subunit (DNA packaging protein)
MIPGGGPVRLYTAAELAEIFGRSERQILEWRLQYGWPCVKIGRTIRFTEAQLEQILAQQSQTSKSAGDEATPAIAGQSKASAARSKAS